MKIDIFTDSSVFIEFFKKNEKAVSIFEYLLENVDKFRININSLVWSEVVYQLVIKRKFPKNEVINVLEGFRLLEINNSVVNIANELIGELYPNDALNFATSYYFGIRYFITLDSDYISNDEIKVINNVLNFKEII